MNALTIALITLVAYIAAYILYARFFGRKVLGLEPKAKTPARICSL